MRECKSPHWLLQTSTGCCHQEAFHRLGMYTVVSVGKPVSTCLSANSFHRRTGVSADKPVSNWLSVRQFLPSKPDLWNDNWMVSFAMVYPLTFIQYHQIKYKRLKCCFIEINFKAFFQNDLWIFIADKRLTIPILLAENPKYESVAPFRTTWKRFWRMNRRPCSWLNFQWPNQH